MGQCSQAGGGWQLPQELAGMPSVWRSLLAGHVADADGRCRGCRSQTGAGSKWPCTLYRAAAQAQLLAGE